jgi:hypothetical protein
MKDLFFVTDLLTVFRNDNYYGVPKTLSVTLRKFGLTSVERADNIEQMFHALVVHIMDQRGESEPFLAGTFIYPEAVIKLLKEHGLPVPDTLQPESTTKKSSKGSIDRAQFEQYFDIVCRNCGTVTDPLAAAYRTPIGRLIFRTFLETRLTLGINATGRYVLEHLTEFDTEKVVTSVNEDSVTWLADESREKITSVQTIAKFVLNFNREIENLL